MLDPTVIKYTHNECLHHSKFTAIHRINRLPARQAPLCPSQLSKAYAHAFQPGFHRFRQWHRRVPPNQIEKWELNGICSHYRRVFWALSASKMHTVRAPPEPHWGSLQHSPRPIILLACLQELLPFSRPLASNFMAPPRQISGYTHGFRE